MGVRIGTGSQISFGTTNFTAEILDITPPQASREAIRTSHMLTPGYHTFCPADLVDWGELEFEIHFDPAIEPPINQPAETITITFADSAATTWSFSGFMTAYHAKTPLENMMTGTIRVKVTGNVTIE
jgi:hypothetical protein